MWICLSEYYIWYIIDELMDQMFCVNSAQKQWRILDFPDGVPNPKVVGLNLVFWRFSPGNSKKLKQNGYGGHASLVPPLGYANEKYKKY